jgi:hypothetical protein
MSLVKIQGNASGTGEFTIAAPNTNTDYTLTLPTNTGTILTGSSAITASQLPAGSVLQVVGVSNSTVFSTSSASDQDTGLFATITPTSASSKVLILLATVLRATVASSPNNNFVYQKLWRGAIGSGTLLLDGYPIMGANASTDIRGTGNSTYLDAPATTSAVTYRVSINSTFAAAVYINSTTDLSTLTLLEIAA